MSTVEEVSGRDVSAVLEQARRLTVLVRKNAGPLLAEHALTIAGRSLLLRLDQAGPATVPTLAHHLLITRQVTQRLVDELVLAGHLERHANPRSQRSHLYALTDLGRRTLHEVTRSEQHFLDGLGLQLDPAHVVQCLSVLQHLGDAMNGPAGDPAVLDSGDAGSPRPMTST